MDHDPEICMICVPNDRVRFDAKTGHHYVPRYCDAAFPLFKLYPIGPEPVLPPHVSAQTGAEDHDTTPIDAEHGNRIVEELFTEIQNLRGERDCLRSALVDAGFSLRVERIAHYADHQPARFGATPS